MSKGLVGYKKYFPYRNVGEMEALARTTLASQGQDFDVEYKAYNHPELAYIARILRILSVGFEKFCKLADDCGNAKLGLKFNCVIIPTPDNPELVNVYSGLTFGEPMVYSRSIRFVNKVYQSHLLDPFVEAREKALENSKSAKAWENIRRVGSRVKRFERMSVSKAITNYSNAKAIGMKDNDIRDLATAIVDSRKPVTVTYAERPEDFVTMYGSGPGSCMTDKGDREWAFMISKGIHPTSYFAYFPYTRGAYILKGGKVAARCIIYEYKDKKQYGRVYANSQTDKSSLENHLAEKGYVPCDGRMFHDANFKELVTFEIPGIAKDKNSYAMPLPYFDNMHLRTRYEFDNERKIFKMQACAQDSTLHNIRGNLEVGATRGCITARLNETMECTHCGVRGQHDKMLHHTARSASYCSGSCMRNDGAVEAQRSDGIRTIVDKSTCIEDDLRSGYFYTNIEAFKANGGKPYLTEPYVPNEDDEELTAAIYVVHFGGRQLGIQDTYFRAQNGNLNYDPNRNTYPIVDRNKEKAKATGAIAISRVRSLQMDLSPFNVEIDGVLSNIDVPVKEADVANTIYSATGKYEAHAFSGEELIF